MRTLEDHARSAEICRRGQEMYERHILPKMRPDDHGLFLILDVETGDYELGSDDSIVSKLMSERYSADRLFGMRVGHAAAEKTGPRREGPVE